MKFKDMSDAQKQKQFIASCMNHMHNHKVNWEKVIAELEISRASYYQYKKLWMDNTATPVTSEPVVEPEPVVAVTNVPAVEPKPKPSIEPGTSEAEVIANMLSTMMRNASVDESKVQEIVKRELANANHYRGVEITGKGFKPKKVDGVFPEWAMTAMRIAAIGLGEIPIGVPTTLIGPSGCGKTHAAGMIAKALDLRFGALSLSGGVSETFLTGLFVPTGEGGKFEYIMAHFLDFVTNGGLFLLDEVDGADANVLVHVHTLLANGYMHVPALGEKGYFEAHKNFRLMCAGNTNLQGATRQYQGRSALDGATVNRLQQGSIICDYSETVEKAVSVPAVYSWGLNIRKKIRKAGLRREFSTRDMKNFSLMHANDFTLQQCEDILFATWSEDEKRKVQTA